jgi:ATP-dependent helicase YprA (DUF1998 family)
MSDQGPRRACAACAGGTSISVIVATDRASRGLDLESLTHVINYDVPTSITTWLRARWQTSGPHDERPGTTQSLRGLRGRYVQLGGRYRQGRISVIVATDRASRGLDLESLTHVINYDVPTRICWI